MGPPGLLLTYEDGRMEPGDLLKETALFLLPEIKFLSLSLGPFYFHPLFYCILYLSLFLLPFLTMINGGCFVGGKTAEA
jgi:hypothetical protein